MDKAQVWADDLPSCFGLIAARDGVIVMCSSLGRQFSMEDSDVGHGYFTYSIVQGLRGKADANADSFVYLHEADRYAAQVVGRLSRGRQTPTTGRPPHIRSFPLARR